MFLSPLFYSSTKGAVQKPLYVEIISKLWHNRSMRQNISKKQIIKILRNALREENKVLFCYLFGSFAYGNITSKSDIDIAVYLRPEIRADFFDIRLNLIAKLTHALGREVDVLVLNTAPSFLRYVVLKEGLLLLDRDLKHRIEFELKSINEYFDYKPILDIYRARLYPSI